MREAACFEESFIASTYQVTRRQALHKPTHFVDPVQEDLASLSTWTARLICKLPGEDGRFICVQSACASVPASKQMFYPRAISIAGLGMLVKVLDVWRKPKPAEIKR